MTDAHPSYCSTVGWYQKYSTVNESQGQCTKSAAHNNSAESFGALLERAKFGVLHYLSKAHLNRYLHEIGFRWNQREPKKHVTKTGEKKIVMGFLSVIETLAFLVAGVKDGNSGELKIAEYDLYTQKTCLTRYLSVVHRSVNYQLQERQNEIHYISLYK